MDRSQRSPLITRVFVAGLATLVMACSTAAAGPLPSPSTAPARSLATAAAATTAPAAATHDHTAAAATTSAPQPSTAPASTDAATTATAAPTTAPTTAATVAPTLAPTAPPAAAGPIAVTLVDVAIKLDRASTASGSVTFVIKNAGTVIHQLVVLKTDIAQNQIPANPSQPGTMSEPGFVTQTPVINVGGSYTLTLTLASGNYVLMCNQPAHYLIGMHTGFVVN